MSRRRKNRNKTSAGRDVQTTDVGERNEVSSVRSHGPVTTLTPKLEYWILGIILAVGCGLRFFHLGFQSLWRDELATIQPALNNDSILNFFLQSGFGDGPHPPFAHIVVRLWAGLFGTSDWALRASTALFGCLALLAAYLVARRLFARAQARLLFTAFNAVSIFLIYYSQEVRAYIIAAFWILIATERFLAWLERPSIRNALLYGLASAAIFFTHYVPIFHLFSHGFVLLVHVLKREHPWSVLLPTSTDQFKRFYRSWGGVHLLSLFFAIPRLIYVFGGTEQIAQGFWMWKPNTKLFVNTVAMFFGVKLPPWALYPARTEGIIVATILTAIVAAVVYRVFSAREDAFVEVEVSSQTAAVSPGWLAIGWVGLGFSIPWLISYFSTTNLHIFLPRTVIYVVPGVLLAAVVLIQRSRIMPIRVGIIALMMGPSLGTMPWYYNNHHKQQWRDAVAYIDTHAQAGDKVQERNRPFHYYSTRTDEVERYEPGDLNKARRIWVVREVQAADRPTIKVLKQLQQNGYQVVQVQEFNALAVALLVKP